MTIIKVSRDGKALIKKKDETVVPLAPESTEPSARAVQVRVAPAPKSRQCFNIILLTVAIAVLAAGIIGGVFLFKYMIHRSQKCHVTVQYEQDQPPKLPTPLPQDGPYPQDAPYSHSGYYVMEEDIDIQEVDDVERIEVPRFDECRRSVVIHDFRKNLTVIVDNDDHECFLMDLDREHMSPPRSFAELIRKYTAGYYMPKVDVIRRDYRVMYPALQDLQFAGINIMMECAGYNTYMLEKRENLAEIIDVQLKKVKAFGYSDLKTLVKDYIECDFGFGGVN